MNNREKNKLEQKRSVNRKPHRPPELTWLEFAQFVEEQADAEVTHAGESTEDQIPRDGQVDDEVQRVDAVRLGENVVDRVEDGLLLQQVALLRGAVQ